MSWLTLLFHKKQIEPIESHCRYCHKTVEFPEHLAAWQRTGWEDTAICGDCQLSHWEMKRAEEERQEQEYFDRIADAVVAKLGKKV